MTGSVSGSLSIGGILGSSITKTIFDRCFSTANVWASSNSVGGIVGSHTYTDQDFLGINRSFSSGDIRSQTYVGGLGGKLSVIVSESYSTANVSASNAIAGGLAGSSGSKTLDSYFNGSVYTDYYGGGLVGYETSSVVIERSYFSGNLFVLADTAGGIFGGSAPSSLAVLDSFVVGTIRLVSTEGGAIAGNAGNSYLIENTTWLESASLPSTCVQTGTGTPCSSTPSLDAILNRTKGTVSGWDFDTPIWTFPGTGSLPLLSWQLDN